MERQDEPVDGVEKDVREVSNPVAERERRHKWKYEVRTRWDTIVAERLTGILLASAKFIRVAISRNPPAPSGVQGIVRFPYRPRDFVP